MEKNSRVKVYTTEAFRQNYIQAAPVLDQLLRTGFGKFFILRVEEMSPLMKLPIPPVRTTGHILLYLTSGGAEMNVGSQRYTVGQDECLLVPAGQVFSFDRVDVNTGYLCSFQNEFLRSSVSAPELQGFEFLQIWGNPHIRLNEQTTVFVARLLGRLRYEYVHRGITNAALLQAYTLALLTELNEAYHPAAALPASRAANITNRFQALLFTHFRTKHRVTEYADLLHLSPNHLNKAVRGVTGKSPRQWIDEAIVLEAKVLLYQSERTVAEIAAQLGFWDASYFSRLFKKYEGITPLTFRRRIEQG